MGSKILLVNKWDLTPRWLDAPPGRVKFKCLLNKGFSGRQHSANPSAATTAELTHASDPVLCAQSRVRRALKNAPQQAHRGV